MEKIKGTNKEKILKQIIGLEGQERAFGKRLEEIEKKKQKIFTEIIQDYRTAEDTPLYFELKEKILQNDEAKRIIEKYGIPINEIAFIEEWFERPDFPFCPQPWSENHVFKRILEDNRRPWAIQRRYLYGGPGDKLKIIFRDCHNGRYVLTGYQFKFPEKPKRDWKATFKKKAT